jgi:hypothetical protein
LNCRYFKKTESKLRIDDYTCLPSSNGFRWWKFELFSHLRVLILMFQQDEFNKKPYLLNLNCFQLLEHLEIQNLEAESKHSMQRCYFLNSGFKLPNLKYF